MTSQDNSPGYVRAAIIGGIFTVIAACIGGVFLIVNTLVSNGFIVIGPSVQAGNPNQPTTTAIVVTATALQSAIEPTPVPTQSSASSSQNACPTREHTAISVGTGALKNAVFSDGFAECPESTLKTYYPNTQWIHPSVSSDGCGVSNYNADRLWLAAFPDTVVTVNGSSIGEYTAPANKHGYVFEYQIQIGDKICVSPPTDFTLIWGPDIYYEYDSYCFRGWCN